MDFKYDVINKITNAFQAESPLVGSHTLAACDYYDEWRWFPEDGDLNIISGREGVTLNFDDWPSSIKDETLKEINHKKITNKTYSFLDVSYEYLDLFSSGVPYLDERGYKFYLAAWMINVINHTTYEGSLINEYFFYEIESHHTFNAARKKNAYSLDQLSAIANFLHLLKLRGTSFHQDGASCLDLGWKDYLNI